MLQSTPLRSTRARFGYERIKRDHFTVKKRGGAALVVACSHHVCASAIFSLSELWGYNPQEREYLFERVLIRGIWTPHERNGKAQDSNPNNLVLKKDGLEEIRTPDLRRVRATS